MDSISSVSATSLKHQKQADTSGPSSQTTPQTGDTHDEAPRQKRVSSDQVTLSYSQSRQAQQTQNGTEVYSAEASDVNVIEKPVAKPTEAASNILGFISQRLHLEAADGAELEQLQQRLEEGFHGFVKGFNDAFAQLDASGLLSPEVAEAITQTFADVMTGTNLLAEELGLVSPVDDAVTARLNELQQYVNKSDSGQPENALMGAGLNTPIEEKASLGSLALTPKDAFIQSILTALPPIPEAVLEKEEPSFLETLASKLNQRQSVQASSSNSLSLTLKTQDGDEINLQFLSKTEMQASQNDASFEQGFAMGFTVSGELDDGERKAIGDLMAQLGKVSEAFFSGNLEEALSHALDVTFDASEIGAFEFNLRKVQELSAYETHAQPAVAPNDDSQHEIQSVLQQNQQTLNDFLSLLESLVAPAEESKLTASSLVALVDNVLTRQQDGQSSVFLTQLVDATLEGRTHFS